MFAPATHDPELALLLRITGGASDGGITGLLIDGRRISADEVEQLASLSIERFVELVGVAHRLLCWEHLESMVLEWAPGGRLAPSMPLDARMRLNRLFEELEGLDR